MISPTRELSLQIFEVLREFGKHHQLSAGLITGGKKEFREEQTAVIKMNILVATPGRLLQHLEQTPGFDPSLLQVGRDALLLIPCCHGSSSGKKRMLPPDISPPYC